MSSKRLTITWEVEDGYAGPSRPQSASIDRDELLACDTVEEVQDLIGECVKSAFDDIISPSWTDDEDTRIVDEWRKMKGVSNGQAE